MVFNWGIMNSCLSFLFALIVSLILFLFTAVQDSASQFLILSLPSSTITSAPIEIFASANFSSSIAGQSSNSPSSLTLEEAFSPNSNGKFDPRFLRSYVLTMDEKSSRYLNAKRVLESIGLTVFAIHPPKLKDKVREFFSFVALALPLPRDLL